jgi:hypothetical protein
VDCALLSAWPIDSIFYLKTQAHAAIHSYWLSLSVPAQSTSLLHSSINGPDGGTPASVTDEPELAIVAPRLRGPGVPHRGELARPWRATATKATSIETAG